MSRRVNVVTRPGYARPKLHETAQGAAIAVYVFGKLAIGVTVIVA